MSGGADQGSAGTRTEAPHAEAPAELATLDAVGASRTLVTHLGRLRGGGEMLLVGALAAAVAYGIGALAAAIAGG